MKYDVRVSFELETTIEAENKDDAENTAIKEFWQDQNAELLNLETTDENGDLMVDEEE